MNPEVVSATIKIRPQYTCGKCGAKAAGKPFTLKLQNTSSFTRDFNKQVQFLGPKYKPVGYVATGYGYECSRCERDRT